MKKKIINMAKFFSILGVTFIIIGILLINHSFTIIMQGSLLYKNDNTKTIVYVSNSTGNDSNSGLSSNESVKTLTKALVIAKSKIQTSNVEIVMETGTYEIDSPIQISNDYTNKDHTITITGNGSTISGGTNINNNKTWTQKGNNIWEIDISDYHLKAVPDLWVNGKRQKIAQEELDVNELKQTSASNRKYLPHVTNGNSHPSEIYFLAPSTNLNLSSLASDRNNLWFEYHWSFKLGRFSISEITQEGTDIKFLVDSGIYDNIKSGTSTYGMYSPNNNTHINNNSVDPSINRKGKMIDYTLKNAYSLLNEEGEFYYNRGTKKLYYYSSMNPQDLEMIISLSDGLFRIEGTRSKLVSNINFNNIFFKYGTNIYDTYLNFPGNQGDILDYYDKATGERTSKMIDSQLFIKYASNINFDYCTFENLGSNAVAIDSFVYNSTITNSEFKDIGASAVRVGSLDRKSDSFFDSLSRMNEEFPTNALGQNKYKVFSVDTNNYFPANIEIKNNSFITNGYKHIGSPTIFVTYANSVNIENNRIEDATYSAISMGWGWHNHLSPQALTTKNGNNKISNNYITNVVNRVVDGAPIYHLGYAGEQKNIINGNYINTNEAEKGYNGGIYLDEGTDNVDVYSNVVMNCMHWIDVRYLSSGNKLGMSTIIQTNIYDNYANKTLLDGSSAYDHKQGRMAGATFLVREVAPGFVRENSPDITNGQYTGTIVNYLIEDEVNGRKKNIIDDNIVNLADAIAIKQNAGYSGEVGARISSNNIYLNTNSVAITINETYNLLVSPEGTTVNWTSSNNNVATVDNNGKVTGVSAGQATITAKTLDGTKTATCTVTVAPISVTGITLNKENLSIRVGENSTLIATVVPNNATNKSIEWTSSNNNVATIDNNGKVTGVSAGQATITATTVDGTKTATCTVTVAPISVTGITLNKETLSINVGGNSTLIATVAPSNATNKSIEWTSSNNNVATIDNNGKVTGVGAGQATITATTVDGTKTATCTVTVSPNTIPVTGITLNKGTLSINVGGNSTLIATVAPSNATNKNINWTSSDNNVATVDNNGKVTGVSAGQATITATTVDGTKTATCTVTVSPNTIPVTGITLNKETLSINVGGNSTLIATVAPSNATNKNINWTSSNNDVATVDNNGKVTGVSAGQATITAKTLDGTKTATCTVTVSPNTIPVTGITLNKGTLSINVGGNSTLIATVAPSNATNKNINWTSSNNDVATVNNNGKVTGVSVGQATITATTVDGTKTATCTVTVTPNTIPVTGITLNKETLSINVGGNSTLIATVAPSNATNKNINWTSSDNNVATVNNNGKVTGVSAGQATITATTVDGAKTATCTVTVTSSTIPVDIVEFNSSNQSSVEIGKETTLSFTILPENVTNKKVIWESSNPKIATVDDEGRVKGLSEGRTTISITTEDGSKTASWEINVYKSQNDDNKDTKENVQVLENIPNTNMNSSKTSLIIGLVLIISGICILCFKKKNII